MSRGAAPTQIDAVVGHVRDVLGSDVIGVYLYGSAVSGGLRPQSDLDLLAVSRRRLSPKRRRQLLDRLLSTSGAGARPPARPVELTVVVQSDVRPWRYPPRVEFQYGEWLRREFAAGVLPMASVSTDLVTLLAMVLSEGRSLFGPPPGHVLDPVPLDDLLRAVAAGVPNLLADLETDTTNVLLTLARVWVTVATGTIKTKDGAADWSMARLPGDDRRELARARAIYLGAEQDRWDDLMPRARVLAEHVIGEIEARVRAGPNRYDADREG